MKQGFPRRIVAGLLFAVLTMAQSQSQVSAVSISAKPSLVLVNTIKVSSRAVKGKVEVTVGFGLAVTHAKAPLLLTEVKVGSSSCRAVGKAMKCVVKNVSSGKTFKVVARAKNRNGYGQWSKPVSLKAAAGFVWRVSDSVEIVIPTSTLPATTMPVVTTTTLPVAKVDLTRATVLGTSSMKLAKLEGLSGAGVGAARVRPFAVGDVIFNTAGIIALAQAESASQSGSKLLAVTSSGALTDGLLNGTAVVKDFYSAPNGNIYVVFESKVALVTGGTPCLLAKIEVSTGVPLCVDSTLDSISALSSNYGNNSENDSVQFDNDGAIYYSGLSGTSAVLRKYKNGLTTDLVNDNISLKDFVVINSERVIISGYTKSTDTLWLRRISNAGNIKNLASAGASSMWLLPNGDVLLALVSQCCQLVDRGVTGMRRYLFASDELETKYWIQRIDYGGKSRNEVKTSLLPDAYWRTNADDSTVPSPVGCGTFPLKHIAFCNDFVGASNRFNVPGVGSFAIAGGIFQQRELWMYYPTPERANINAIRGVTLGTRTGKTYILAGTDSKDVNVLSLYDTSSKQETVVMDGSNEVEIYSMSYSQKKNAIMFSGLRFSDNKYVVGEVSLG